MSKMDIMLSLTNMYEELSRQIYKLIMITSTNI